MEGYDQYLSSISSSRSHSNSDVVVELAGISPTSSPSLEPSNSRLMKRRSWGNRTKEVGPVSEPVHLELEVPVHLTSPRSLTATTTATSESVMPTPDGDSVHLLADDQVRKDARRSLGQRNGFTQDTFYSIAGSSMVPLMSQRGTNSHSEADTDDGLRDDQHARLTTNMSHITREESLGTHSNSDPEHEGGASPHTRRKSLQYNLSPSPLRTTETVMKSVSKNIRRMSLRVVNLANNGLEGQLRLADGEDDRGDSASEEQEPSPRPDLKQIFPLRGRALGFLGPESRFRLALFKFLIHPYVATYALICSFLTKPQLDGTFYFNSYHFKCHRPDQAILSFIDATRRWLQAPIPNQGVLSNLGRLCFVRTIYCVYVSVDFCPLLFG